MNPWPGIRALLGGRGSRRSAFESLLAECCQELYRGAYSLTRNADEAEDLLQETTIRAFRSMDRFEPGTNFRAWMWRIMTNLYITEYRKASRRGPEVSLDDIDQDLWTGPDGPHIPEDALLDGMLDEELGAALDALPDSIRDVMVMTEIHEMPYKDVASVLNIPVGTVRSRLFRGRLLMRQRLAEKAVEKGWVE